MLNIVMMLSRVYINNKQGTNSFKILQVSYLQAFYYKSMSDDTRQRMNNIAVWTNLYSLVYFSKLKKSRDAERPTLKHFFFFKLYNMILCVYTQLY